jgi:hypothetical protein
MSTEHKFTSRFELVDHVDFAVIERDGVEVLRMPREQFFKLVVVKHAAKVLPEHWALT